MTGLGMLAVAGTREHRTQSGRSGIVASIQPIASGFFKLWRGRPGVGMFQDGSECPGGLDGV